MKTVLFCLLSFYLKSVYSQNDYSDQNEVAKVMDQYKLHPLYQKVKEEFYNKYGNKIYNVMERITIIKDQLRSFFELTNRKNIPDSLKTMFRTAINGLKPDFGKMNHNKVVLKSFFNLTDEDANTYVQLYSEAEDMFSALQKRFKIESDC